MDVPLPLPVEAPVRSNVAPALLVVATIVPTCGIAVYTPSNVMVPPAVNVLVWGAGGVKPATAPNVQVYEPVGILGQVLDVPFPLPVEAPVRLNVALALLVVATTVPVPGMGTYTPLNVIVPPMVKVFVWGAGVVKPATAPNVHVYEPAGMLGQVLDVPLPLPVEAPVRLNVALALSVVATTVPTASVTLADEVTVHNALAAMEMESPIAIGAIVVTVAVIPDTLALMLALVLVTAKPPTLLETLKLAVAPAVELVNVHEPEAVSVFDGTGNSALVPVSVKV